MIKFLTILIYKLLRRINYDFILIINIPALILRTGLITIIFTLFYIIYSVLYCYLTPENSVDSTEIIENVSSFIESFIATPVLYGIKENNLSLKKLKAELDNMKSKQPTVSSQTITTDKTGKHNIVTRFYRKSSLPVFWIFSTLLTYGNKIPIISKILKGLKWWYGRTTWWKLLVSMRKMFIIFNALLGVYTVFKMSGFSTDNLIGGFYGLGHTYVEMLSSFTKRLFNWFVELFDHKIVPKPPTDPSTPPLWKWWEYKESRWLGRAPKNTLGMIEI
jgi:hypothetical protein